MPPDLDFWLQNGSVQDGDSNAPILLNQGRRAWLVLSGGMDIFAVRLADGRAVGVRVHLFRVPAGQAFWELEGKADRKVALLAVALPETRLAELGQEHVRELARQPAAAEKIRELLDKWLSELSRVPAGLRPPPHDCLFLRPGMSVALQPGQTATSRQGVVWVGLQGGAAKPMGLDDLPPLPAGSAWFPLVPGVWLEAATDLTLQVWATDDFFLRDLTWQALTNFHGLILEGVVRSRQQVLLVAAQKNLKPELNATLGLGYGGLQESGNFRDYLNSINHNTVGLNYSASLMFKYPLGNNAAEGLAAQKLAQKRQAQIQSADLDRKIRSNVLVTLEALTRYTAALKKAREAVALYQRGSCR